MRKRRKKLELEIRRLQKENESCMAQLNKAVEVGGIAMNGRWYADDGRYCGEIKMPQLIQATGTIVNLKVNDEGGITKGIFLAPDSNARFLGNRLVWDNSPDETGDKIWQRKDDPTPISGEPTWAQKLLEEMRKERDAALAKLANATQSLQDHQKLHEATKADLEALRNGWKMDEKMTGENNAMKVEVASMRKEVEKYQTKAEELTKSEAAKSAELTNQTKKLEELLKAHEELKVHYEAEMPENEAAFSVPQDHEFAQQAYESLKVEHEKVSADCEAMRADQEKTRKELRKYKQENEVLKIKSETHLNHLEDDVMKKMEANLDAITSELEYMKLKYSMLEKDNIEKTIELDLKKKALESMQRRLRSARPSTLRPSNNCGPPRNAIPWAWASLCREQQYLGNSNEVAFFDGEHN